MKCSTILYRMCESICHQNIPPRPPPSLAFGPASSSRQQGKVRIKIIICTRNVVFLSPFYKAIQNNIYVHQDVTSSISYQNEAQRCSAQRTFTYLSIYLCPKKVQQLNFQFEGTGRHKEKPEEMIKEELREVFRKIKLPKVQKIT